MAAAQPGRTRSRAHKRGIDAAAAASPATEDAPQSPSAAAQRAPPAKRTRTAAGPPAKSGAHDAALLERARSLAQHYAERLAKSENELCAQRAQLRARHDEAVWDAACLRDLRLAAEERLYAAELAAAQREADAARPSSPRDLLATLTAQRRRLAEEMRAAGMLDLEGAASPEDAPAGQSQAAASQTTPSQAEETEQAAGEDPQRPRKTRGRRPDADDAALRVAGATGPGRRRAQTQTIGAGLALATTLMDHDIADDLAVMAPESSRRAARAQPGSGRRPGRPRTIVPAETQAEAVLSPEPGASAEPSAPSEHSAPSEVSAESALDVRFVEGEPARIEIAGATLSPGDAVTLVGAEGAQIAGSVGDVGPRDVWVDVADGARLRVTHKQLRAGAFSIRRAS